MPAWQYPQGLQSTVTDLIGADTNNNTQATTNVVGNADGSVLERLEFLQAAVSGTVGLASFPAAAAPANDVSLAEVLNAIYTLLTPVVVTGTTDIDDSVQTETSAFAVLTIAPAAAKPLVSCEVWLDLAKATTGFAAVETSVTVTIAVARKVDGTNWRRQVINEAALSGTLAASRMQRVDIGPVSVTEQARLEVTFSSDVTADMEIPYAVVYRALGAPTITDVAAG